MLAYSRTEASGTYNTERTSLQSAPWTDVSTNTRRRLVSMFLGGNLTDGGTDENYQYTIRSLDNLEQFRELYIYRSSAIGVVPWFYISSPQVSPETAIDVAYNSIAMLGHWDWDNHQELVDRTARVVAKRDDIPESQKHAFYRAARNVIQKDRYP